MSEIKNGGPAFPWCGDLNDCPTINLGMDFRDYFAAKVLPSVYENALQEAREGSGLFQHDDWRFGIALDAYALADAMLRARGAK
ncbi:hypothetical protein [Pandoraea terrigena]|uniref:Gp38 n=1 Tax=Pandoraea terrigena TaxID=2508292 RepID=A0A5E4V3L4_9BURK|nr:hypothetical protein [Pandoraea terrigena]VVE06872.1 gp38 [Pandoraea terrigena]